MQLPKALQQAIEQETGRFSEREMVKASEALSQDYRNQQYGFSNDAERIAYLAARLPATFGAVTHALRQIPSFSFKSLLDLGAGPGTVMWAASELLPEIEQFTLIEKDAGLADLGKRLASHLKQASWQIQDLEQGEWTPHDLVVFSYSIGELKAREKVLQKAWQAATKMLLIIEPGTPAGFERIRSLRSQLIALGGHMIAPCPHMGPCPMSGGDWCHFSERVERSSLHRRLKGGSLGYEDEKFSYIVFAKEPYPLNISRVLRHPLKRTGHVTLSLCTKEGLKQVTISKKMSHYKEAKKLEWDSILLN